MRSNVKIKASGGRPDRWQATSARKRSCFNFTQRSSERSAIHSGIKIRLHDQPEAFFMANWLHQVVGQGIHMFLQKSHTCTFLQSACMSPPTGSLEYVFLFRFFLISTHMLCAN